MRLALAWAPTRIPRAAHSVQILYYYTWSIMSLIFGDRSFFSPVLLTLTNIAITKAAPHASCSMWVQSAAECCTSLIESVRVKTRLILNMHYRLRRLERPCHSVEIKDTKSNQVNSCPGSAPGWQGPSPWKTFCHRGETASAGYVFDQTWVQLILCFR